MPVVSTSLYPLNHNELDLGAETRSFANINSITISALSYRLNYIEPTGSILVSDGSGGLMPLGTGTEGYVLGVVTTATYGIGWIEAAAGGTGSDHSHTNKTWLDTINQNLNTTASPSFSSLNVGGNVDGVDISSFKADFDTHSHSTYSLNSHTHSDYALTGHDHASYSITHSHPYSLDSHEHTSYSITHSHPYSLDTHDHSSYSLDSHAHASYSITHSHPYASDTHDHPSYSITHSHPYASDTHSHTQSSRIGCVFSGAGAALTASLNTWLRIPYSCTISAWHITSDLAGSAVVEVGKCTYASFPTFSSIAGTEKPTLVTQAKNEDTNLSSWTTTLTSGDYLQFSLSSVATSKYIELSLDITR